MKNNMDIIFDGIPAEKMTQKSLIDYCHKYKNKYISDLYAEKENGNRLWSCLIDLMENGGGLSAKELHEHGMSDEFNLK